MVPLEGISILPPSRDRQAFPEFYAELDVEFARVARSRVQVSEGSDADAPGVRTCDSPAAASTGNRVTHSQASSAATARRRPGDMAASSAPPGFAVVIVSM